MSTLAELLVKVGADVDDLEAGMDRAAGFVDSNFGKITAAGVAAGAGLEGFARKQAPLNESLRQTAAALGINEGALRDLALETSNVTFPLEEVLGLFEQGRRQGLETGEELQRFASFWDMVGDATGESGVALGEAGVALRAVGIAAGDEGQALDAFGFITDHTTSSVGDFLKFLERTGPQLRDMGLDIDDTAAVLGVLENELGMTGRTARQEFRKAVNEADGDLGVMLDTLGISTEQFDQYRGAVDDSSGVIERNAAIHAEAYTPMEKLAHGAEELMFKYGGLASVAGALAMPLMALGPIMKLLVVGKGAIIGISKGLITVLGAVGKAFLVLSKILLANPWVLVAAAIIALVVVVVKNWDTIKKAITTAWNFIKSVTSKVWNAIKAAVKAAVDFLVKIFLNFTLPGLILKHWNKIRSFTSSIWNGIRNVISSVVNAISSFVRSVISRIVSFVVNGFNNLRSRATQAVQRLRTGVTNLFRSLLSFVGSIPGRIVGFFSSLPGKLFNVGKNIIQSLINGVRSMIGAVGDAVSGVVSKVTNLWPFSPAKEGPLRRHPPELAGRNIGRLFAEGISDAEREVVRAAEAITGLTAFDAGAFRERIMAQLDAQVNAEVVVPEGNDPRQVTLDVTGADEDMKRMIRKWLRTAGLAVEVRG